MNDSMPKKKNLVGEPEYALSQKNYLNLGRFLAAVLLAELRVTGWKQLLAIGSPTDRAHNYCILT